MLQDLFKYYLEHQSELVKQYNGQYLVIVDNKVVGAFPTDLEAVSYGEENYKAGEFLVQRCSEGNKDYSRTYHSRVYFAQ